jgi:hypothetical protein
MNSLSGRLKQLPPGIRRDDASDLRGAYRLSNLSPPKLVENDRIEGIFQTDKLFYVADCAVVCFAQL